MNRRHLMAGALSASLLVSASPGLALAQDEGPYAAEGVEWTLTAMNGVEVPEGVVVTLLMSGGDLNGNAGCNSYSGSYEIDAETLTFPNPFVATRMFCEGPAQDTEDEYLPTLQSTAGWSVEGDMLILSDADGNEILVYGSGDAATPVEVTTDDVAALQATLEDLQAQIDVAEAEIAALVEAAAGIPLDKMENQLTRTQEQVTALEKKTEGPSNKKLDKRVTANEQAIANISNSLTKLRKRITALEEAELDHEERIAALEAAVFVPTPT